MKLKELLDKILEKQDAHNSILERLTATVEVHEKRSTALEQYVKTLEDRVVKHQTYIDRTVGFVKISTGLIITIGGLLGILSYVISLIGKL